MSSRTVDWEQIRSAPAADQVALWLDRRGRRFDAAQYCLAVGRAAMASNRLEGLDVATWLARHGFTVVLDPAPCTYGTAIVRAELDLDAGRITVYQAAVDALSWLPAALVQSVLVAHETFHILDPSCPDPLAEMAAHLFAGQTTPLACFAGLLDVIHPSPTDCTLN